MAPILPPEPHYVHFEGWNALIPSNQGSWARATQIGDIRLTPLQHAEIIDQHAFLWVFGFFCYSALGNRSIDVGFLVRWDTSQGFVPEPNRAYEYQRKSNV